MNNRKLLYILLALGLLFLVTQLFNQKKERSFKSEFLALDTSSISKMVLHPQADGHKEIQLEKVGDRWTAQQGSLKVPVSPGSLNGLLNELASIRVKSIATRSKDRWAEYEIGDSTGSRVEVFSGNKKLADFYSGKFGFNPQGNSMISYVRSAGEEEVYAIDGFQSMTFNTSFSNFRDKTLLDIEVNQVTGIRSDFQGLIHSLIKDSSKWVLDDRPGPDSASVATYLNSIQRLNGTAFLDGFSPSGPPSYGFEINTGAATVNLKVYPHPDSLKPFILHSTANPDAYFHEDSTGAFNTLIGGWNNLIGKPVSK